MRAVAVSRHPQLISVPHYHFGAAPAQPDMTGGAHAAGQKRSKRASRQLYALRVCDAMMRAREYLGRWRLI